MFEERQSGLADHVENGAAQAAGVYALTHILRALGGLFRRRRAYGRTRGAAGGLLIFIWLGFFMMMMVAGEPGTSEAALAPVAAFGALALAIVPWLLTIKVIELFDRKTGRPVRMARHWVTQKEIDNERVVLQRRFNQLRGSLPMDALLVVGFGMGGFLGADVAGLEILQQQWHALDEAELALQSGGRWWFEDGPTAPPSLRSQFRRWRDGVSYRSWVQELNGQDVPPVQAAVSLKCSRCGHELPGARFCPSCGTSLGNDAEP